MGVCASRKIALACERHVAFLAIVGEDRPDFRPISDFRKVHREAFQAVFVQVVTRASQQDAAAEAALGSRRGDE